MKLNSIKISEVTKKRLVKIGNMDSTYESVINELLDHVEGCERFWVDRT